MRRPCRTSPLFVVLNFLIAVFLGGCGGSPCADLTERVCAVTDARSCGLYREGLGGERPSNSQSEACATVLADPTSLKALTENLAKRSGR